MSEIWHNVSKALDPEFIIHYGGLVLLCLVVFAENGVFFCFFFPGDYLILTGGILTATGVISQPIVVVELCLMASAILGYMVGYWFGDRTGPALYKRKDSFFFKKKYIESADEYYKKYGGQVLIIGRFLPVIRTFSPILAGIIKMRLRMFMLYNLVGSVLWIGSFCTIGYILGHRYKEQIMGYLGYIVIGLIVVTAIPIVRVVLRERKQGKK